MNPNTRLKSLHWILILLGPDILGACSSQSERGINAYAEGTLTIRVQEDSTKDYSGFEVLVITQTEGDVDTLGVALTDVEGHFAMDISAVEEGVFPILISRAGTTMAFEEYVVVDGDSTTISGAFPLGGRRLRIISPENAAWTAYRNTKVLHNETLLRQLRDQTADLPSTQQVLQRTSTILWSLRANYPGTRATDLASAEAIVMLEGWNDSLVVDRLAEIRHQNPNIVSAIRAARRSFSRIFGQDSSLSMVRSYMGILPDEDQKAALHAEIVVAYSDSFRTELALSEAMELRRRYPDSDWSEWASRAAYEFENLLPGMPAPSFSVVSKEGNTVSSENLKGRFLIIEFYEPTNDIFLKELGERSSVVAALDTLVFETLSISLDPDSVINSAIFEEFEHPGIFAFMPDGRDAEIARNYNVQIVPTRFLIDPEGLIISKYPGSAMLSLEDDLIDIIQQLNRAATQ